MSGNITSADWYFFRTGSGSFSQSNLYLPGMCWNRMKKIFSIRVWLQGLWAFLTNPYLPNFLKGTIHQGSSKAVCVPGLNCYSCPAAAGACPLGSLQSFLAGNRSFPAYILGTLILFGIVLGRAVCGFLCPFGWIQELLNKIGGKKARVTFPSRIDKLLRYCKYLLLVILVLGIPLLVRGPYGQGVPAFCKYVCPVGTLEAGIPLAIANPSVRAGLGWIFSWKGILLIIILVLSILIHRPFCKYICPLGAIYAFFNRMSIVRLHVDNDSCISCGKCEKECPMQVKVLTDINNGECIRCGKCILGCPVKAIHLESPVIKRTVKEDHHETL